VRILLLFRNNPIVDPRIVKEIEALTTAGHEVDCHCRTIPSYGGLTAKSFFGNKCTVYNHDTTYNNYRRSIMKRIKNQNLKYDIIYAQEIDTLPFGVHLKRVLRVPLVYDVHDLYFTWFKNPLVSLCVIYVERVYLNRCDLIICSTAGIGQSEGLKEYIERYTDVPVEVIWNHPSMDFIDKPTPAKKPLIVFTGSVNYVEMLYPLIDCCKDNGYDLKVTCYGREAEYIKDKLERLGMKDSILPKLEKNEVINLVKTAWLQYAVYDNKNANKCRGVSTKTFESLLLSVPHICMSNTLAAEFASSTGTGFVAQSFKDVSKTIKTIIEDKKLLAGARKKCDKIKQQYVFEKGQGVKLVKLFEEMVQ